MTKTDLLALTNGFISAVGKVVKSRHISANTTIIDEIYREPVFDSNELEIYTQREFTGFVYSISLKKTGNIVDVNLLLRNTTSGAIEGETVFIWKNTQFKPLNVSLNKRVVGYESMNKANTTMIINTHEGLILSSLMIPSSNFSVFNFSYLTEQ